MTVVEAPWDIPSNTFPWRDREPSNIASIVPSVIPKRRDRIKEKKNIGGTSTLEKDILSLQSITITSYYYYFNGISFEPETGKGVKYTVDHLSL